MSGKASSGRKDTTIVDVVQARGGPTTDLMQNEELEHVCACKPEVAALAKQHLKKMLQQKPLCQESKGT